MNVLLVSQCNKRALAETRRILDQFAERRGDRTWQTPITQAGLDTLRKLLRKSARRNTAVACHWIRGRDHSELLWIVGDARRFNPQGAVPTNTTSRNILRRADENDWHSGEDIRLLAAMAALLHDLGKSCEAFQLRLQGKLEGRNLYRHEWISLRLFQSFVGDDDDHGWLTRLADAGENSPEPGEDSHEPGRKSHEPWLARLERDGLDATSPPFQTLPPLAAALGWLILSHHRLPMLPRGPNGEAPVFQASHLASVPDVLTSSWNENANPEGINQPPLYWQFPHALPVTTAKWRTRTRRLARRLLQQQSFKTTDWLNNPYVMHLARLSLMLADHHYSSLEAPDKRVSGEPDYPLHANTVRCTGQFNQRLDEHLLGVEQHASIVARGLPSLASHLPRLARHKGFRKRSDDPRFRWQDRAHDLAQALRETSQRQGFFGINMASTGCGKTLANGRILYALADPQQGARFSVALGLRTLTLQTARAYRQRLNLGEDELAVRVGGSASRTLFEHYAQQAEDSGSASLQQLIEEDSHVLFEGNFDSHAVLSRISPDTGARTLVAAPIMVCTVDHLVPATDSTRGGRQIAPMLRLMSSDLVLDEIDDFDINDLPALTRLVNWAGLLGARVLLSSATIPPSLAEGLYEAYRRGREHYQSNRGEPGLPVDICCAWFDERDQTHANCADGDAFSAAHRQFASRRHQRLATNTVRRRGELIPLQGLGNRPEEIRANLARQLRDQATVLHVRHHSIDPHSGKRVSFGLIRMANIDPLFDIALELFRLGTAAGQRIHLCVYHSRHPLLVRSAIEQCLDRTLNRHQEDAVFELPEIRQRLDHSAEPDQLFIVLGSPVTEVGRDHDYDWAIVEPSSMRSIIQLAGRVMRHRDIECREANIALLDSNLRYLEKRSNGLAFQRPGFESSEHWKLSSHSLEHLLKPEEWQVIDARPRILERDKLKPKDSLVDLEHTRLREMLLEPAVQELSDFELEILGAAPSATLGAYSWYSMQRVHLLGVMSQYQPFREQRMPDVELALLPDESGEGHVTHRIQDGHRKGEKLYSPVEKRMTREDIEATQGERIQPWATADYMTSVAALAEELDLSLDTVTRKFGIVTVPDTDNGWRYHPVLGFSKRR